MLLLLPPGMCKCVCMRAHQFSTVMGHALPCCSCPQVSVCMLWALWCCSSPQVYAHACMYACMHAHIVCCKPRCAYIDDTRAHTCIHTHTHTCKNEHTPGAGKSHFADDLKHTMMRRELRRAYIDGSDDRLVDMALLDILDQELPDPSVKQFLVVDEFHMLGEHHKSELFHWLQQHARRLHVLLIANRKDSRDDELLASLRHPNSGIPNPEERVIGIQSRLGSVNLKTVMEKNRNKHRQDIMRWVHCCRYDTVCTFRLGKHGPNRGNASCGGRITTAWINIMTHTGTRGLSYAYMHAYIHTPTNHAADGFPGETRRLFGGESVYLRFINSVARHIGSKVHTYKQVPLRRRVSVSSLHQQPRRASRQRHGLQAWHKILLRSGRSPPLQGANHQPDLCRRLCLMFLSSIRSRAPWPGPGFSSSTETDRPGESDGASGSVHGKRRLWNRLSGFCLVCYGTEAGLRRTTRVAHSRMVLSHACSCRR